MADTFIWYELMTSDLDSALDFYRAIVGWSTADEPNAAAAGVRYAILSAGERGIGGAIQLTDEMTAHGARPGWLGYIGVADTDAKAKAVADAGGKILMGPADIPNVGRFALVADPGGAPFHLMTPNPRPDVPPVPEGTPGTVGWHELYAGGGEKAAFAFYSSQFGWETLTEMDMGPMGVYRIFGADGARLGGMMNKPEQLPTSVWGYYFHVDGIDAAAERVRANGGTVRTGPMEVPDESWIIQGSDPQGAAFSLVSRRR
jgi:predicted enzyme related to lactoylglutathione lyase